MLSRPYQEDEMYVRAMVERNYGFMCAEFSSLWGIQREQVDEWFEGNASLLSSAQRADILDQAGPYDYGTWQAALEINLCEAEFEEFGIVGPLVITRAATDGHSLTNDQVSPIRIPAGARATVVEETETPGLYDLNVEHEGRWYWAAAYEADFEEVSLEAWEEAGG